MIELAVSLGYLSQADGEALRHSARRTNAIAHGDLSSPATTEEVAEVLDRVATLAAALRERGLKPRADGSCAFIAFHPNKSQINARRSSGRGSSG